jgi:hypothetical protein
MNLFGVIRLAFPIKITKTQAKILLHREPDTIWGCLAQDNAHYKLQDFREVYGTLKEQLEAGFLDADAFRHKQLLTDILNDMTSGCTALDELRSYQDNRKFGKWSRCASDLNKKFKLVGLNISPITIL